MHGSDGHGITDLRETRRIHPAIAPVTCSVLPINLSRAKAERRDASMDVDDWNSPTTKLLTLLNVSAAKSSKRKFSDHQGSPTPLTKQKLNKRRVENPVPGNDDMETAESEVGEPEQGDSTGEVGVGEAADVSGAEGV